MISSAMSSEVCARAAIARSCALSFVTASDSAADRNAVSMPLSRDRPRAWRVAAMKRSIANVSTATSTVTIAVSPRNAWPWGVIVSSKESAVPVHERLADKDRGNGTDRQKTSERQLIAERLSLRDDQSQTDERAQKRAEHETEQHELPPEEGADHSQHLQVAHPHTFYATEAIVAF